MCSLLKSLPSEDQFKSMGFHQCQSNGSTSEMSVQTESHRYWFVETKRCDKFSNQFLEWRCTLSLRQADENVNEENCKFDFCSSKKSQHQYGRKDSMRQHFTTWTLNCSFDPLHWAKWMHNKYVILNLTYFSRSYVPFYSLSLACSRFVRFVLLTRS